MCQNIWGLIDMGKRLTELQVIMSQRLIDKLIESNYWIKKFLLCSFCAFYKNCSFSEWLINFMPKGDKISLNVFGDCSVSGGLVCSVSADVSVRRRLPSSCSVVFLCVEHLCWWKGFCMVSIYGRHNNSHKNNVLVFRFMIRPKYLYNQCFNFTPYNKQWLRPTQVSQWDVTVWTTAGPWKWGSDAQFSHHEFH